MTSKRKNVLVGITVLGSLILLGWMILRFGGQMAAPLSSAQLPVHFVAERGDGVFEGSPVLYRGVNVGRIVAVSRDPDDPLRVRIDARLDSQPPLPANVEGVIRTQGLIGAAATVNLELLADKPTGQLQPGTVLPARFIGLDLIPREVTELARELQRTTERLREIDFVTHLDQAVQAVSKSVTKAGDVLDSVQAVIGDEKLRGDVRTAVANLRTATDSAVRIGRQLEEFGGNLNQLAAKADGAITKAEGHVDAVGKQFGDRLEQVAKLLETFQAISSKIEKGEGTAGRFVGDPRLYESLVDSSKQLSAILADMKRLVEQWEQEGVTLRLGGK